MLSHESLSKYGSTLKYLFCKYKVHFLLKSTMPVHACTNWSSRKLSDVLITSLAKEIMFLVALVCLFVCLFVDNITQKVVNGLG